MKEIALYINLQYKTQQLSTITALEVDQCIKS